MESTRFTYLSMAMFTRTDAMFHSCYLKQNKKQMMSKKNFLFFALEDIPIGSFKAFQKNYCKVLVSFVVRIPTQIFSPYCFKL